VALKVQIEKAVSECDATAALLIASLTRNEGNIRHAPLAVVATLHKQGRLAAEHVPLISQILKRADEPGELLSLIKKDLKGKKLVLSSALKRAIGDALNRFDGYQLGKYKGAKADFSLRDVIRLTHPKPETPEQSELFSQVLDGTLPIPDTWETQLSAGKDKREVFTRLLQEGKLGYLALLRNLRNMSQAGVSADLVRSAILARRGASRVLPFRYIAAARHAPQFEPELDSALITAVKDMAQFSGRTLILVDVSGSMADPLSSKSDLSRMDAAATLAAVFPGEKIVYSFSEREIRIPSRVGMSGVEKIISSQEHSGTYLGRSLRSAVKKLQDSGESFDRVVVITDEQAEGRVDHVPGKLCYMINVASNKNGVGFGPWVRINGFSENIFRFMKSHEEDSFEIKNVKVNFVEGNPHD
jgi:hypothetical protein